MSAAELKRFDEQGKPTVLTRDSGEVFNTYYIIMPVTAAESVAPG